MRLAAAGALLATGIGTTARAADRPLEVWVSIPPQIEIVERVGGEHVRVHSLTRPGDSPHTFEPSPKTLAALWEADLYLRIGMPFEDSLLGRIGALHPELDVGDLAAGIERVPIDAHHAALHPDERLDPHIWLDPVLVQTAARTAKGELCRHDPDHCTDFERNLAAYQRDLDALNHRIGEILGPFAGRTVHVFHPAYGYLLRRYGLEQAAVEVGGKEPTPRQLAELVDEARGSGGSALFVQPQLAGPAARAVAEALGWPLIELDPLAPDLSANLERMARRIAAALGGGP